IVGTTLPPARRPTAIALISATLGFGGAIGLPLAGIIADYADFHLIFWLCVLVGVLGATWIWLVVPESEERTGGRVDYAGAALLTLTLATLLLPLSDGSTWGWSSPATLALAVAFPVLAVVFVRHQTGRPAALVDIRTVRRRPILLTNIASVLVGFSL